MKKKTEISPLNKKFYYFIKVAVKLPRNTLKYRLKTVKYKS